MHREDGRTERRSEHERQSSDAMRSPAHDLAPTPRTAGPAICQNTGAKISGRASRRASRPDDRRSGTAHRLLDAAWRGLPGGPGPAPTRPSSGGTGIRLKSASATLSASSHREETARRCRRRARPRRPGASCENSYGIANTSSPRPSLSPANASSASAMFAPGPAAAIQAARCGWRCSQYRIVGCARPADREAARDRREQRHQHHAERLALHVRQRIERDLPAEIRGVVATQQRRRRVGGFVRRDRDDEDHVPDERVELHARASIGPRTASTRRASCARACAGRPGRAARACGWCSGCPRSPDRPRASDGSSRGERDPRAP